jgi:hypothetical protein
MLRSGIPRWRFVLWILAKVYFRMCGSSSLSLLHAQPIYSWLDCPLNFYSCNRKLNGAWRPCVEEQKPHRQLSSLCEPRSCLIGSYCNLLFWLSTALRGVTNVWETPATAYFGYKSPTSAMKKGQGFSSEIIVIIYCRPCYISGG